MNRWWHSTAVFAGVVALAAGCHSVRVDTPPEAARFADYNLATHLTFHRAVSDEPEAAKRLRQYADVELQQAGLSTRWTAVGELWGDYPALVPTEAGPVASPSVRCEMWVGLTDGPAYALALETARRWAAEGGESALAVWFLEAVPADSTIWEERASLRVFLQGREGAAASVVLYRTDAATPWMSALPSESVGWKVLAMPAANGSDISIELEAQRAVDRVHSWAELTEWLATCRAPAGEAAP